MMRHSTRLAITSAVSVGATSIALLSMGLPATSVTTARPDGRLAAPAAAVCGNLRPDRTFAIERSELGNEHACEHLRERQFLGTKRARHQEQRTYAAAVAALSTTDPAVIGEWSTPFKPATNTVGIAAVLLHTGKVLIFGGKFKAVDKNTAAYIYDPVTGDGHELTTPAAIFCGSVTQLSDGRVLSVGGTDKVPTGLKDVYLFDPASETWIRQPDSPLGRYYPTSTRLADGTVIITAGTQADGKTKNPNVELYSPPSAGGDVGTMRVVGPPHATAFYPRQWVMPDGNLVQVIGRKSYRLDTSTWQWSNLPGLPVGNGAGSAGVLLPGAASGSWKILMTGGLKSGTALTSTELFDYSNPSAGWKYGNPMPTPRSHMNLVQVPDGTAFGIGGNSSGLYGVGQPQTLAYNPNGDTWTNMAVQSPRRGYHSTAVLLPDGRIMSAGDTGAGGGGKLIDFYSPPYLFQGPRPEITTAPSQVNFGASFDIGTSNAATATRAVLMAPAATTHADEMNARHVELAVSQTAGGFTATAPGPRVAPPGYYMLFVVTADGIPSVAKWVHIG